jgi:DNA-binding NarL/FixJ family response regulator
MAAQPGIAPRQAAAELSVVLRAEGSLPGKQIERTLEGAGCRLGATVGEETHVVVDAHRRAGAAVCAEIRELSGRYPGCVLVLVVERAGAGEVRRALQAGAHAVVTASSVESALVPSIGAALAGQIAIPARAGADGAPKLLTTREKQILGLVVMGMSNAEIAAKLFLAESTVKSHLSSAFVKLGVSSRSEATAVILDPRSGAGLGILTIPSKP